VARAVFRRGCHAIQRRVEIGHERLRQCIATLELINKRPVPTSEMVPDSD
jgi:hypothetical protein